MSSKTAPSAIDGTPTSQLMFKSSLNNVEHMSDDGIPGKVCLLVASTIQSDVHTCEVESLRSGRDNLSMEELEAGEFALGQVNSICVAIKQGG